VKTVVELMQKVEPLGGEQRAELQVPPDGQKIIRNCRPTIEEGKLGSETRQPAGLGQELVGE